MLNVEIRVGVSSITVGDRPEFYYREAGQVGHALEGERIGRTLERNREADEDEADRRPEP